MPLPPRLSPWQVLQVLAPYLAPAGLLAGLGVCRAWRAGLGLITRARVDLSRLAACCSGGPGHGASSAEASGAAAAEARMLSALAKLLGALPRLRELDVHFLSSGGAEAVVVVGGGRRRPVGAVAALRPHEPRRERVQPR